MVDIVKVGWAGMYDPNPRPYKPSEVTVPQELRQSVDEILFDFIGSTDNVLILPDHRKQMREAKAELLALLESKAVDHVAAPREVIRCVPLSTIKELFGEE